MYVRYSTVRYLCLSYSRLRYLVPYIDPFSLSFYSSFPPSIFIVASLVIWIRSDSKLLEVSGYGSRKKISSIY
jgi:hypothetical protein